MKTKLLLTALFLLIATCTFSNEISVDKISRSELFKVQQKYSVVIKLDKGRNDEIKVVYFNITNAFQNIANNKVGVKFSENSDTNKEEIINCLKFNQVVTRSFWDRIEEKYANYKERYV